ncbi:RNA polymerase sigma factor [Paenibacillus sp. GCM10027626]|uniref:RNA polymerase sigma factor n=1 Tax=Paenibacillus sp. GCM10027626 TaxID=3273411 RepID=UPI003634D8D8
MTIDNEQIKSCWQELYKYVQKRVRSPFDAEDLTQETFARALRAQMGAVEEIACQIAFLKTIAKRLIIDKYRKDSRHPLHLLDNALPIPDPSERPEQCYEQREFMHEMKEMFANLHVRQKTVLECRLLQDLTIKETAECLYMTEGNVKSLQFRAVRKVREQLGSGM